MTLSLGILLRMRNLPDIFVEVIKTRLFFNNFSDNRTVYDIWKKVYSFCLMVEASDHGYVLHTRRIHVTRYRIRYDIRYKK
jgi:hypothetical protein